MVKQTVTDVASQKAFLLIGSGATIYGLEQGQLELIVLGIAGVFLGALSYIYEYAHSDKRKSNTKLQTITEATKYIIFGGFAMPSITLEAGKYVEHPATQVLIGALASWAIVDISSVIIKKVKTMIKEFRK